MSDRRIESTVPASTEFSGGTSNVSSSSQMMRAWKALARSAGRTRHWASTSRRASSSAKRSNARFCLRREVGRPRHQPDTRDTLGGELIVENLERLAIHVSLIPENVAFELADQPTNGQLVRERPIRMEVDVARAFLDLFFLRRLHPARGWR
jgi:hypothetical protein